jgi:hypothetical protein
MRKLILSVAVVFAMSSFCVFAQDTKPAKKEGAKTEQGCKKDAKAEDKKECCTKDAKADSKTCCQKDAKKDTSKKAVADKK